MYLRFLNFEDNMRNIDKDYGCKSLLVDEILNY